MVYATVQLTKIRDYSLNFFCVRTRFALRGDRIFAPNTSPKSLPVLARMTSSCSTPMCDVNFATCSAIVASTFPRVEKSSSPTDYTSSSKKTYRGLRTKTRKRRKMQSRESEKKAKEAVTILIVRCIKLHGTLSSLVMAYTNDEDRYSGAVTDNFDRKFRLFIERCDQADIPEEDQNRAFSIMLVGNARHFFFDSLSKILNLMSLAEGVEERFQTPERTRALLFEWEALSLKDVTTTNRDKTPSACLEVLIAKLADIQTSFLKEHRHDTILWNKLLNAVGDIEDSHLAYHKPAESVQGVISDLHASLASAKKLTSSTSSLRPPNEEPSAYFVDRRYHRRDGSSSRNAPSKQN